MKLTVMLGLMVLAAPAMAQQAPDRLCDGLAAIVKSAGEAKPFGSLGKEGSGVVRPAGMEGAHSCEPEKGGPGHADKLVCTWMLGGADRAATLPQRVKACAATRGWTEAKMTDEKEGVVAARLIKPGSTLEVVALSMASRTPRVESLTVLAPKR